MQVGRSFLGRRTRWLAVGRWLAIGMSVLTAGSAFAQTDETERWVPSFSVRSGVTTSIMSGSVDSFVVPHFDYTGELYCNSAALAAGCQIPEAFRTHQEEILTFEFAGLEFNPDTPDPVDRRNIFTPVWGPGVTPAFGDEIVMNPWVGASIELMTPGLQSLPTRPRFFVHGDVQYQFGVPRSVARSTSMKPSEAVSIGLPPGYRLTQDSSNLSSEGIYLESPGIVPPGITVAFEAPTTVTFPSKAGEGLATPDLINGQGSKVDVTEHPWVWGAGAGVAFTFELFERRLRVKPSVEYQRRKLTITTAANQAYTSAVVGDVLPGGVQPNFNIVQLAATEELELNSIGPGLEIEMDTWQVGPMMLSVFVQGSAYRILGETEITNIGLGDAPCDNTDGSNLERLCQKLVDFTPGTFQSGQRIPNENHLSGLGINEVWGEFAYEIDPWTIQAGVGLRFRAVPDNWIPQVIRDFQLAEAPTTEWQPW